MDTLSRLFVVAVATSTFLFTFSEREIERHSSVAYLTAPVLRPGETSGDMAITTGVEDAIPFWVLCSSTKENDHSILVDCGELSYNKLAIGHTFGVMDLIRQCINWEDFIWEMSVDGQPIDLEAFGVYDIVRPDLAPGPSSLREVFTRVRLWDVLLVDPTPGLHRLQGQAQSRDGTATYTWVVNFTVAASQRPALSQRPHYLSLLQAPPTKW